MTPAKQVTRIPTQVRKQICLGLGIKYSGRQWRKLRKAMRHDPQLLAWAERRLKVVREHNGKVFP